MSKIEYKFYCYYRMFNLVVYFDNVDVVLLVIFELLSILVVGILIVIFFRLLVFIFSLVLWFVELCG